MQIFYFLQIYEVCLLIHGIHCSRVILAGNQQAFQNLAKDFVPQKLAFELARLIASTSGPHKYNEWETEVATPATTQPHNSNWDEQEEKISNENEQYVQDRLHSGRLIKEAPRVGAFEQYSEKNKRKEPKIEAKVQQIANGTQRKSVRLNMDELVNKVKEKIISDLRNSKDLAQLIQTTTKYKAITQHKNDWITPFNSRLQRTKANNNRQRRDKFYGPRGSQNRNLKPCSKMTTRKRVPKYHFSDEYGSELEGPAESQESLRRKKKDTVIIPPAAISVNKPPGFKVLTPKAHVGEVVESHDLYEKVRLKKKGKKDSYEDYVFPEKDANPFDNDGVASPIKEQDSTTSKKFKERPKPIFNSPNHNANKTGTRGFKHKRLKQADRARSTKTTKSVKRSKSVLADMDDIFYEDEESEDEVSENPKIGKEPRAATMFIDGDYEDYPLPSTVTTIAPMGYINTKRTKMKIVTNMATRTRYTPKHISYYEKLALAAEKYNFDEPIPEKDREDATTKNKTKRQPA